MYRGRQKTFPRNDFLQDVRSIRPVCSNGKSRSVRPFRTHARSILPIGHPCRGYTLFRSQIHVGKRPDLHSGKNLRSAPDQSPCRADRNFRIRRKAVGAGCSMGVDSLATIKQHYIDDNRYGHKITHLAIFNTCEFGFEDANEANKLFRYEYSRAAAFARETGLELLYVQSNVTSLLNRYGTGLYDTCTLVHAAAILFLENSTPYITTRAGICSTSSNIRHKVWNISISSCSTCVPPEIRKYSPPSQHKSEPNARNTSSTTLSQKIPARLYQDHRRRSRSQLRTLLQMPKDIGSDQHTREAPRIRNDLRSILLQNAQSRHLCEISRIPGGRSLFADILNFAKQKGFEYRRWLIC